MSANNYLKITKGDKGFFELREHCADEVEDNSDTLIGDADTLEGVIKMANDFQQDNEVEYGLQVDIS